MRTGVILVIVLVVIALLALSAYTFSDMMLAHHGAAEAYLDLSQSNSLVHSGVAASRTFLLQEPQVQQQMGGVFDNPTVFQSQVVVTDNDDTFRAAFSIVAPTFDNTGYPTGLRFGLQNESAKINLNALVGSFGDGDDESVEEAVVGALVSAATGEEPGEEPSQEVANENPTARDALMNLPGMTLEVADAILDWMDDDDEPREYGAEVDYYSSLIPAYGPKNGPLQSLSELLLVKGITPELLFGRDQNRNGLVDANELNRQLVVAVDPSLGSLDLGWRVFLTLDSRELELDPTGQPRINLNSDDLETLYTDLAAVVDSDLATFVIAFRQNGPAEPGEGEENGEDGGGRGGDGSPSGDQGNGVEPGEAIGGRTVDLTKSGGTQIESLLDLVDINVNVQFDGDEEPTLVASPFFGEAQSFSDGLLTLMDYATVADEVAIGRINVNEAPRPVLMTIPGMTADAADTIAAQPYTGADMFQSARRHPVWLWMEGFVDLETMQLMMPYVTGGGNVFKAHIVGHFSDGTRISRSEVVIDATRPDVPIVGWKDMAAAGRGFTREELTGVGLAGPFN